MPCSELALNRNGGENRSGNVKPKLGGPGACHSAKSQVSGPGWLVRGQHGSRQGVGVWVYGSPEEEPWGWDWKRRERQESHIHRCLQTH